MEVSGMTTGVAITNLCDSTNGVHIEVRTLGGVVAASAAFDMRLRTHVAKFIDEFVKLPSNFLSGTLRISAPGGSLNTPVHGYVCTALGLAAFDLGNKVGQFVALPVRTFN
jgi:hypothetical protein